MVAQLLGGGGSDRYDAHVTGVETIGEASNRSALAGGVEALEQDQ
jgi:hypothetical protein